MAWLYEALADAGWAGGIRKSSRLRPASSIAASHFGGFPRPAQVKAGFSGSRNLGATLYPWGLAGRLPLGVAFEPDRPRPARARAVSTVLSSAAASAPRTSSIGNRFSLISRAICFRSEGTNSRVTDVLRTAMNFVNSSSSARLILLSATGGFMRNTSFFEGLGNFGHRRARQSVVTGEWLGEPNGSRAHGASRAARAPVKVSRNLAILAMTIAAFAAPIRTLATAFEVVPDECVGAAGEVVNALPRWHALRVNGITVTDADARGKARIDIDILRRACVPVDGRVSFEAVSLEASDP